MLQVQGLVRRPKAGLLQAPHTLTTTPQGGCPWPDVGLQAVRLSPCDPLQPQGALNAPSKNKSGCVPRTSRTSQAPPAPATTPSLSRMTRRRFLAPNPRKVPLKWGHRAWGEAAAMLPSTRGALASTSPAFPRETPMRSLPYEVIALRGHCRMSLLQEAPYEVTALRGHCLSRKPPMRSQLYEVTAFSRKPPMRSLPPSLPQEALMRSLYYKVTAL